MCMYLVHSTFISSPISLLVCLRLFVFVFFVWCYCFTPEIIFIGKKQMCSVQFLSLLSFLDLPVGVF